ncbi:MAG: UDP-N-acetylglucosamine 1-carboxyvinyltransferase [Acidobacteriota bacterium]|jgi:UDP-N-acetylglucosamine 1-carboxyvinyltransferase|nr:UDP-N-acetylglucosamine 1-carboxyvinyltransferase [Acidobacteriota bacterium]NLT33649.1 UDP-N-acetylglucosamine 1-carboxyvinyltransferase [Acidobacteriota bacterium]
MDKIRVVGGVALRGRVETSGAKNAALPAMAATLLTGDAVQLENLPRVRDILTTRDLLEKMGAEAEIREDGTGTFRAGEISSLEAPYELVKTMRASILVLGPLLGRFRKARVSLPGGCAIGARPVNIHLAGLEKMGAVCEVAHGYVEASTAGLTGAYIQMETVTVTGTENLMMAATLADGETVLDNAACEPEVVDLAAMLRAMGAHIEGDGTRTIRIRGVRRLRGCRHRIIPDRIEAGTFAVAGAITRGEVEVANCNPEHLKAVLTQLAQAGAEISIGKDGFRIRGRDPISSKNVTTYPYPAFPTDMQAQYMALMTQGDGIAIITETIFENRFLHALEMIRMGADITVEGRQALVRGGRPLTGAAVLASDLRASASLILAGLVAEGETVIDRVYHLDRGYYRIEDKMAQLGARIERIR